MNATLTANGILVVMSATNSPTPAQQSPAARTTGEHRSSSGMNVWGWLAVVLFVTSGVAITAMLVLKWINGGGEVWPWFTRYAFFAFPAAFLCLVLALLQTLLQRRRH